MKTLNFRVAGETTVAELKEHIAASTGVCGSEQRLIYGVRLLQDSEKC